MFRLFVDTSPTPTTAPNSANHRTSDETIELDEPWKPIPEIMDHPYYTHFFLDITRDTERARIRCLTQYLLSSTQSQQPSPPEAEEPFLSLSDAIHALIQLSQKHALPPYYLELSSYYLKNTENNGSALTTRLITIFFIVQKFHEDQTFSLSKYASELGMTHDAIRYWELELLPQLWEKINTKRGELSSLLSELLTLTETLDHAPNVHEPFGKRPFTYAKLPPELMAILASTSYGQRVINTRDGLITPRIQVLTHALTRSVRRYAGTNPALVHTNSLSDSLYKLHQLIGLCQITPYALELSVWYCKRFSAKNGHQTPLTTQNVHDWLLAAFFVVQKLYANTPMTLAQYAKSVSRDPHTVYSSFVAHLLNIMQDELVTSQSDLETHSTYLQMQEDDLREKNTYQDILQTTMLRLPYHPAFTATLNACAAHPYMTTYANHEDHIETRAAILSHFLTQLTPTQHAKSPDSDLASQTLFVLLSHALKHTARLLTQQQWLPVLLELSTLYYQRYLQTISKDNPVTPSQQITLFLTALLMTIKITYGDIDAIISTYSNLTGITELDLKTRLQRFAFFLGANRISVQKDDMLHFLDELCAHGEHIKLTNTHCDLHASGIIENTARVSTLLSTILADHPYATLSLDTPVEKNARARQLADYLVSNTVEETVLEPSMTLFSGNNPAHFFLSDIMMTVTRLIQQEGLAPHCLELAVYYCSCVQNQVGTNSHHLPNLFTAAFYLAQSNYPQHMLNTHTLATKLCIKPQDLIRWAQTLVTLLPHGLCINTQPLTQFFTQLLATIISTQRINQVQDSMGSALIELPLTQASHNDVIITTHPYYTTYLSPQNTHIRRRLLTDLLASLVEGNSNVIDHSRIRFDKPPTPYLTLSRVLFRLEANSHELGLPAHSLELTVLFCTRFHQNYLETAEMPLTPNNVCTIVFLAFSAVSKLFANQLFNMASYAKMLNATPEEYALWQQAFWQAISHDISVTPENLVAFFDYCMSLATTTANTGTTREVINHKVVTLSCSPWLGNEALCNNPYVQTFLEKSEPVATRRLNILMARLLQTAQNLTPKNSYIEENASLLLVAQMKKLTALVTEWNLPVHCLDLTVHYCIQYILEYQRRYSQKPTIENLSPLVITVFFLVQLPWNPINVNFNHYARLFNLPAETLHDILIRFLYRQKQTLACEPKSLLPYFTQLMFMNTRITDNNIVSHLVVNRTVSTYENRRKLLEPICKHPYYQNHIANQNNPITQAIIITDFLAKNAHTDESQSDHNSFDLTTTDNLCELISKISTLLEAIKAQPCSLEFMLALLSEVQLAGIWEPNPKNLVEAIHATILSLIVTDSEASITIETYAAHFGIEPSKLSRALAKWLPRFHDCLHPCQGAISRLFDTLQIYAQNIAQTGIAHDLVSKKPAIRAYYLPLTPQKEEQESADYHDTCAVCLHQ